MKKITKFFMVALLAGMCNFNYAQQYEWEKPSKPNENEVGVITTSVYGGFYNTSSYSGTINDNLINYSKEQLYEILMTAAADKYAKTYPKFALRNFKYSTETTDTSTSNSYTSVTGYKRYYKVSASVVVQQDKKKVISMAMNKALRNVPEGSRLAIDRISSDNDEIDRETLKDQVIDMLLDKGYRMVAKDYLAKLYEEQQAQQSGIYNERTTVQENNFSAVGYYINVKVTETSVRVQVVNVSTGEYEGNATVNF